VVKLRPKSTDRAERERFPVESGASCVQWNTVSDRVLRFQTIRRAFRKRLLCQIALVVGCTLEIRNCLYRIALLFSKRYPATLLQMGAVFHSDPTGVPVECIRTRDCIRDIENFSATRPWATIIDLVHFREGWEAGEKWSAHTRCSCTSANSGL
jgi:hypothetical protein